MTLNSLVCCRNEENKNNILDVSVILDYKDEMYPGKDDATEMLTQQQNLYSYFFFCVCVIN